MNETKLAVIDGETLMAMRLPPTRFCVQTLLTQGVTVLGGAEKPLFREGKQSACPTLSVGAFLMG